MRNMGIRAVTTSHFLLIDIDFWPDTRLYDTIKDLTQVLPKAWFISAGGYSSSKAPYVTFILTPLVRSTSCTSIGGLQHWSQKNVP